MLTHDIRRGGAKDLARLDEDIMKVATNGVMRGLGNHNLSVTDHYLGHEEKPPIFHKSALPEVPIDPRLLPTTGLYQKPTAAEVNQLVDDYLRANPDMIPSQSRDLDFLLVRDQHTVLPCATS